MKTMTVREALREAMAEEMRDNPNVFLMGEEVGEYQGAYKISQGLLDEFGPKRVIDTPITEHGFAGLAVGAAFGGLMPRGLSSRHRWTTAGWSCAQPMWRRNWIHWPLQSRNRASRIA